MVFSRDLPLNTEYDVIVVGGGPSGCTAAAAAARGGAKTLLIEGTGALGGMGTMGGVPAWCPFSDLEKNIYKGFAEEVFEKSKEGVKHIKPDALNWVPIVPEKLKRIFDDLVTRHGADILFCTYLSAVESKDGEIESVILSNKGGLSAYKAKIYIDCTGDGDLAAWAGATFVEGDEETGEVQMSTLCFTVANVDMYAFTYGQNLSGGDKNSPIHKIFESKRFPHIIDVHMCKSLLGPGVIGFNAGHIPDLKSTDPKSLSKGYIIGRKIAYEIVEALREYVPDAFGNAFLTTTASLMGVRESRRIMGDYILTVDDYLERRSFDDEIGRCSYFIDNHKKSNTTEEWFESLDKYPRYGKGESYGIPYRCLTPKGFRNLLVAGRAISCDRALQASVRVMPPAMVTGEAAGKAAARAVITGDVRKVT